MALLEVDNLIVKFYTPEGVVTAVDRLSYRIEEGQQFGVVGESGAGKSVTALGVLRLIDDPGRIEHGRIVFNDQEAVEDLKDSFPKGVVDLETLREEHTLESVAAQLESQGVSGADLTGDPDDTGADLTDLAAQGQFGMDDVVGYGYAEDIGIVDNTPFIVMDGPQQYIELLQAPTKAMQRIRGNYIAMIFQDAQTALNPVYTVGEQISEAIRHHLDYGDEEAKDRAIELLDTVGIPDAESRYSDYPHEFSGGMQQRVVIAMALSCDPKLLIADEPTTALDVMTEAKVLDELQRLSEEFNTAIQLITHDLGVIAEVCTRAMVLYAGSQVEVASVKELFYDPQHPYTVGLMASVPRIGSTATRLQTIPGKMPDMVDVPTGCRFHPRCPYAEDVCAQKEPPLVDPATGEKMDQDSDRGSACLAHTGDLVGELTYTVSGRPDAQSEQGD